MQYLYLLESAGFFKIGVANDVASRIAQLSTGNPNPIKLVMCFSFENAQPVEKALHQKYGRQRVRGEWFMWNAGDTTDFENICRALGGLFAGVDQFPQENTGDDVIEQIEEVQESIMDKPQKWDFEKMFLDGWGMNRANSGERNLYWVWRRGSGGSRQYIYGGRLSDLPFPIEEMRHRYGK